MDGRIDMHAHFIPDFYRAAASAAGHDHPDGMPAIPAWNAGAALATMDRLDISTALLSLSSPGVHFGDDTAARKLARNVNRFGAGLVSEHPDRFAVLAALPLPDVAGTLDEITFAYDELSLDGVLLETNAGGVYPGDPLFEPVWDALDERSALVVLHPTSPPGWQLVARNRPRPMLEFPVDTARAVTDLLLTGTLQRHPRVTVVVPHGGGVLTSVADRITAFATALPESHGADVPAQLARLYFDLAGMPLPHQLPSLLALAGTDRLLYGSDWPFTPEPLATRLAATLDTTALLDTETRGAMWSGNAAHLLRRHAHR
jgi:predicted TIM-barrel fold metal-dependent hydrolase